MNHIINPDCQDIQDLISNTKAYKDITTTINHIVKKMRSLEDEGRIANCTEDITVIEDTRRKINKLLALLMMQITPVNDLNKDLNAIIENFRKQSLQVIEVNIIDQTDQTDIKDQTDQTDQTDIPTEPAEVTCVQTIERSSIEYYTKENVLFDLKAYAEAGGLVHPCKLQTRNIKNTKITCSNGESDVSWGRYLTRASITLGLSISLQEAESKKNDILKKLKEIAGSNLFSIEDKLKLTTKAGIDVKKNYEGRHNEEYYTKENILFDFKAYAKEGGLDDPSPINTHNIRKVRITCSNGEINVRGATYLINAGVALFGFTISEASSIQKDTIKKLKEIAGIEDKMKSKPKSTVTKPRSKPKSTSTKGRRRTNRLKSEYKLNDTRSRLNPKYYTKENVKHDLEKYAKAGGLVHPSQLQTRNIKNVKITCSNGEANITWGRYVVYAGVALGLGKKVTEAASHQKAIINYLKTIAGF